MEYGLNKEVIQYLEDSFEETLQLIEDLCRISAPSGYEDKRAAFICEWFSKLGVNSVHIDEAKNVLVEFDGSNSNDIILFTAHTDTVFPDLDELPFSRDEEYLYAPGVGDDTTCLAILMIVFKYCILNNLTPNCNVLFAANSCEEGLGNLKGIKQIMNTYGDRIREVYTFDGQYVAVVNKCVGSHRYKITVETEGGHSFRDFGNNNAIALLSKLICKLYKCEVPVIDESITTYNVGIIEGGTSVNTIAQKASVLYEYRSDTVECLASMKEFFENTISKFLENNKCTISVEEIGIRPCGNLKDDSILRNMTQKAIAVSEKYSGLKCYETSGSTDCNIPMSLGVPAICMGSYLGHGEHTREEKVRIDSILVGLKITAEMVLGYFD